MGAAGRKTGRRGDTNGPKSKVSRTYHLGGHELDGPGGHKIGKMQPQTEVNDEAKRSGYNGPKEGISRGGDIKQAEPALRGDKHGTKTGSCKTAANAK